MTINTFNFLSEFKKTGLTSIQCFEKLTEELAITAKHYPEHGITLLDYDMCDSPKSHPIVIECRSLILETETFNTVSRSFDRFFNFGEVPEFYTDFNWDNAIAFEKADGSLIKVYNYNDKWHISTRGMAFAEGNTVMNNGTFKDAVLRAFGFHTDENFQNYFNENFREGGTYIFEYTSPENRVVTPYKNDMMVLLGGMDNSSPYELNMSELHGIAEIMRNDGYNVRMPKTYPMPTNHTDLIDMANELDGLQEGFVVWDRSTGKRIKVKSQIYISCHALRGNDPVPTKKNLLRLEFAGDSSEMILYFPEFTKYVEVVQEEIANTMKMLNDVYSQHSGIQDQKEFALAIKGTPHSGILFAARKLNQTVNKVFHDMDVEKKVRMFLD